MNIPWIEEDEILPSAESAQQAGTVLAGLVAAGGGLAVSRLKEAYLRGMFPWYSKGQPVLWWSPDPRMILLTADFKLHRSLRKTLQHFSADPACEVRINSNFEQVINHCAGINRKGQPGTWIVPEMIEAYKNFHHAGYAHSIETWIDQKLVGGLYCVTIGEAVFGESMFTLESNASKIALAALVAYARLNGLKWIDCQQNTPHLSRLGAKEINRSEFLTLLSQANTQRQLEWNFHKSYLDILWTDRRLP